jgi:hypothetical protein
VLVGGLGLPGGAVRVDPDALHSRLRQALVSAAGPLANVIVALPLLAVLVLVGPRAGTQVAFWSGVAFLVFLQVTAILLSLLPHPWAGWLWDGGAVAAAALGALAWVVERLGLAAVGWVAVDPGAEPLVLPAGV